MNHADHAARMSETQLLAAVRKMCAELGLLVFHVRDSRGSWGPGYPDLTIAGPYGVVFAECKSMHGVVSDGQRAWASVLLKSGQAWRLWRPVHLLDGSIAHDLAPLAGYEVAFTSTDIERITG